MIIFQILSYYLHLARVWLPLGSQWGEKMKWPRAGVLCITLSPVTKSYILCKNKIACPTQVKNLTTSQMPNSLFDLIKIERSC